MDVTAVIVNFNTASHTGKCLRSLAGQAGLARVVVVDNASDPHDLAALRDVVAAAPIPVDLIENPTNSGFAGGCNRGIDRALRRAETDAVWLINSDATARAGGLAAMLSMLDAGRGVDLVGGRVVSTDGERVDSLGIALYASLLASNRMTTKDRLLGPTGGCVVYTRRLLEDLAATHGTIFDERFFCYAEDTDVAVRARLLGYRPGYVDTVVAEHEGQASSGGGFNDFVLYHGIRNSIWMIVKGMPALVLLACLPLVLALHAAIVVRHTVRGKGGVVRRLYRDAICGLGAAWRDRRVIQRSRRIPASALFEAITPRFYDRGYLRRSVAELFRPPAT